MYFKNNLFVNDIRIDLFCSSSPIFSAEKWTSEDVKIFFATLGGEFDICQRDLTFFALHLILGGKLES